MHGDLLSDRLRGNARRLLEEGMAEAQEHLLKIFKEMLAHDRKFLGYLESGHVRISEGDDKGEWEDITEKLKNERKIAITHLEGLIAKLERSK